MRKLFSDFILEGELVILFADNGKGKSILSVQIAYCVANCINEGKHLLHMPSEIDKAKPVIYYDFEMSHRAMANRYTNKDTGKTFEDFGNKLIHKEVDLDKVTYGKDFLSSFIQSVKEDIEEHQAKFIVIDNIKAITQKSQSDNNVAIEVMRELNFLKNEKGITILAIGHSPKIYQTRPISKEDLAGAKELTDFADQVFAIGQSYQDNNLRYLKQCKSRNAQENYHSKNVLVCEIKQQENGFLGFEYHAFGNEEDHLVSKEHKRDYLKKEAKELKKEGLTQRQIATQLSISSGAVNRYLNEDE